MQCRQCEINMDALLGVGDSLCPPRPLPRPSYPHLQGELRTKQGRLPGNSSWEPLWSKLLLVESVRETTELTVVRPDGGCGWVGATLWWCWGACGSPPGEDLVSGHKETILEPWSQGPRTRTDQAWVALGSVGPALSSSDISYL